MHQSSIKDKKTSSYKRAKGSDAVSSRSLGRIFFQKFLQQSSTTPTRYMIERENVFKWRSTNKQEDISAQIEDLSSQFSVEEAL